MHLLVVANYIVIMITLAISSEIIDVTTAAESDKFSGVLINYMTFQVMFLAPTYLYIVLCYLPLFSIILLHMLLRHFDEEEEVVPQVLANGIVFGIMATLMWYILQRRELDRFFEQDAAKADANKARKKELQTVDVLQNQQEAIIIASLEHEHVPDV